MSNHGIPKSVLVWALIAVISVPCLLAADTQSVIIDWSARTTGQQACITPSATGSAAGTLVLKNANVILYTYTLDVRSYQLPSNDAQNLPTPTPTPPVKDQQPAAAPEDCTGYETNLAKVWNNESLFPKNRQSIYLDDTQSALKSEADTIADIIKRTPSCKNVLQNKELTPVAERVAALLYGYQIKNAAIIASSSASTITFPYDVNATHYYVFTVQERTRHNDKLTKDTLKWTCGLEDILTLSLGVMGTMLPYRTYSSQSVPSGSSTQTVLAVSGSSNVTPQGLALLNYKLFVYDKGPQPGFAISTGPAFKFGGSPEVSSFGWFAGISLSFWRRLFITPGVHLGQFADFPPGFSTGSVIPPSFGQLTPVTRWSTRFALGITFRTNSLVKLDNSTPTSTPADKTNTGTPAITSKCVGIDATHDTDITPVTMTASGGTGTGYTFSATGLPAGLTMASSGTISGKPTAVGDFSYTVTVKDAASNTGGPFKCQVTVK